MRTDRRGFALWLVSALGPRGAGSGPSARAGAGEGPAGSLTDVAGVIVGHFTDARRPTGCTAVLTPEGAVCGVDVRGGAPGTRETDLLDPARSVAVVHAVLLAGGSAFGLDAATGVVRHLEERGAGFAVRAHRVPIVPAAILFDLDVGDGRIRPDAAAGYAAARAASAAPVAEGNVGAGAGATVGKLFGMERAMKSGLGSASLALRDGTRVGAVVAVNAVGDVTDGAGRILAGARTRDGRGFEGSVRALLAGTEDASATPRENTTIGVIATDATLDKAQATRVAQMAHDGLARTIQPVHTPWDGDALFVLATGKRPSVDALVLGTAAAEVVARAVVRAVLAARGLPGLPAASDFANGTKR